MSATTDMVKQVDPLCEQLSTCAGRLAARVSGLVSIAEAKKSTVITVHELRPFIRDYRRALAALRADVRREERARMGGGW